MTKVTSQFGSMFPRIFVAVAISIDDFEQPRNNRARPRLYGPHGSMNVSRDGFRLDATIYAIIVATIYR